ESGGDLDVSTIAPGRQLLVISESFHEGWRASVDGAPVPVLRAYGDYMACVVPAGEHRVRLHFEPTSYVVGRRVSALALAAIAAWGGVALLTSRRRLGALQVGDEAARGQEEVQARP